MPLPKPDPPATMTSTCVLLALLLCLPAALSAKTRLCYSEVDDQPWSRPDQSGLSLDLVREAAARAGQEVQMTPLPWKRCLAQLASGQMDGAIAASWLPERAQFADYPLDAKGRPDPSQRLYSDSYALYRHPDNPLRWDGSHITGMNAPQIAVPLGYSVGELLRGMGVRVLEPSKDSAEILRAVSHQLVDGAALLVSEANTALAGHRELRGTVVRITPNLQDKPYYLVFAKSYRASHAQETARWWAAIAAVRDAPAFQQRCARASVTP